MYIHIQALSVSCSVVSSSLWPCGLACQAPLSMGFSKQEYWSGLPFLSPENLPNPGIEPGLLHCRQTLYHLSHQRKMPVQIAVRDTGLISRLGRSPGGGHQNPLQFSCLENPMDRGAWQATAIGSQSIRHYWSEFTHTHTHTHTYKMSGEKNRNNLSFVWRKDFQPNFIIFWSIEFK